MAADLRDNGIELRLSEAVQSFEGQSKVTGVVTDKGRYATDLVVVAAGIRLIHNLSRMSGLKA